MVISERQFSSKPATHDIGFNTRGNDACCPSDTDVDTGAEGAVAHVRLHISLVSLESRSARSPTAYLPYKSQDHTTKDGRGNAGGARVTYHGFSTVTFELVPERAPCAHALRSPACHSLAPGGAAGANKRRVLVELEAVLAECEACALRRAASPRAGRSLVAHRAAVGARSVEGVMDELEALCCEQAQALVDEG